MAKSAVKNYAMFGVGTGLSRVPGQSMATTQSSDISTIERQDNIEINVAWTGTAPVGVLSVQKSTDLVNWFPYDFGSSINITGNSGQHEIVINQTAAPYIQCIYTAISGTGTITANICSKSLSGGAN